MKKNIAVIRGDGIGPEIVNEALKVLDKVGEKFGHQFEFTSYLAGGCAIDACGKPLPEETVEGCKNSDSVLLGAVGGDKWNDVPGHMRPEKGLLRLRAGMGVYSNNRPAKIWPQLADASPLKKSIVDKGIDFIIVRELIGGIYFGKHETYEENGLMVESKVFDNNFFGFTKVTVETAQVDDSGKPVLKKGKKQPVRGASDTEIIPLPEDVDAYMEKNVLPYNPLAYIDSSKDKIGYEAPFTRLFYKFEAPASSDSIFEDIKALEEEETILMKELFGHE